MLVLYYIGSLVLKIGKLAAKLPFGDLEQKKLPIFFAIFFESANRAALFDGESASSSASGAPNSE